MNRHAWDEKARPREKNRDKERMIQRMHNTMAAAALATAVALTMGGCGGGGGDSAVASSTYAEPVEPPAVTSVPAPVYSDARRTGAFNRLNEVRDTAGVGRLAQNTLIDAAAQAHSKYQILNSVQSHDETAGKPGFTGTRSLQRMIYAGYHDAEDTSEVIASLLLAEVVPSQAGARLVDLLMGAPYHRNGMLRPEYGEIGIGLHDDGSLATLTVDFGRTAKTTQGAPNTTVSIWPPENSTDIPTSMLGENPHPIPENNGAPAGYCASVKVNGKYRSIDVTSFEIRDAGGRLVDTKLLSYETDPVLRAYYGDNSFAAALPRSPLAKNTPYTVTFVGTITQLSDGAQSPITRSWSFKTGEKVSF